MPIYTDLSNLIFPKDLIALKYPGGVEQFKMDYKFDTVQKNREDNELISFAQMNSDDFDLGGFLDAGFRGDTKDGFVVFSTDFVNVNRYGGRMWDCPWLEDNGVFFWHVDTSPESKQEAHERCECFVNQIVEKYGSYENWSNTIY
jgi:hypothetical protein